MCPLLDIGSGNLPVVNKGQTCTQQIADAIVEMIESGRLKAGDRLPPERELVRMFGVSRPTIGEALAVLEYSGLITKKIGKGTFINYTMSHSVLENFVHRFLVFKSCSDRELIEFRRFFEPEAAAQAAQLASAEDLHRMESLVDDLAEARRCRNYENYGRADMEFHLALVQCTRNSMITTIYQGLKKWMVDWITDGCRLTWSSTESYPVEQAYQLHRQIWQAVATRRADQARKLVCDHIQMAYNFYYPTPIETQAVHGEESQPDGSVVELRSTA